MKKMIALVMAISMSLAMLAGCGSTAATETAKSTAEAAVDTAETTETESEAAEAEAAAGTLLAKIQESGKIVVGTASGYPPYEFIDITSPNQDVIGIDMALAQAIADELGVELEIQDMSFSSLLAALPAHTIDVAIAGISPTDERKETMDFSDNYIDTEQKVIILKENADKYKTIDDFKGETMAAEKSTTQEALIQELLPECPITSLERVPDCILELVGGKAAGVVVEGVVGEQYLMTNDNLQFSDASFEREKHSAIALEKGNEDLLEIMNAVIQANKDNGNFDAWITEYSEKANSNAAE